MPLDAAVVAFITVVFAVVFGVGVWRLVRRRTPRRSGPLPNVPDAAATGMPIAAPGMNLPYSSLDPYAPPKRLADGTRVDGMPEGQ